MIAAPLALTIAAFAAWRGLWWLAGLMVFLVVVSVFVEVVDRADRRRFEHERLLRELRRHIERGRQ